MTRAGTLSIVATPIGNLGDFSPRAAEVLAAADIIACEDTRVTKKLLRLTGTPISGKIVAYHDHNGKKMRPYLIERISKGDHVALVSDAGTPLISDPGYKLVAACRGLGLRVTTTPGPSAAIAALTISGLPSDRFLFAGFVPTAQKAREKQFAELASLSATSIWFDTPSRLARSLSDMASVFGNRQACVAREITKLHEEALHGSLGELTADLQAKPPMKGEVVIVVAGRNIEDTLIDDDALAAMLRAEMDGQRLRDAVAAVVAATGIAKNRVYKLALEIAKQDSGAAD
ncbi:MAG: 16S rRNA (cytidine(1402)-2'-O)-methyltransferase [Alphaproteobacteria bacterium]|nr:16S rRNA (cytidine(1402)-2'-O)-methyltransferase [Alphaproteobacteria bacterium]